MKKTILLLAAVAMAAASAAAAEGRQRLFSTQEGKTPYRIPAITTCSNGDLIAVADYRHCKNDIGFGAVDLHYRISKDNGRTWGDELTLADGTGSGTANAWDFAFGDCAMAADRTGSEVVALCAAGYKVFFQSERHDPLRVAVFRSSDNGRTWDKGQEITEQIYRLFDGRNDRPAPALFFGSGRIFQSRHVRHGRYYRLYAAVLVRTLGAFALYSDDFGRSWHVLGGADTSPCPNGDEPKCEELPDGRVVLSARTNGRLFNVFTFTDRKKTKGHWDRETKAADIVVNNECNGEIMVLPVRRVSDGKKVHIALQSIPFGPERHDVGFYYRELAAGAGRETAATFAAHWQKGLQATDGFSAYSTMTLQADGRIGLLWEDSLPAYSIDYQSFSVYEITKGAYEYTTDACPRKTEAKR